MRTKRFARATIGGTEHVFELGNIRHDSLDIEKPAPCPCCSKPMTVALDITQWGMFEDKFILLLACVECEKAFWYSYTLPMWELAYPDGDDNLKRSSVKE